MADPRRTQSQVREEMLSGITGLLPAIRQAAEDWVPQTGKALADIYGGLPQAIIPKMITGALSSQRAPSSEPSFVSDKSIGAERYAPGTTERRLATAMDIANPLLAVASTPRAYQIAGKAAANAVNRAIAEGRGPLAQMLAPAMPMAVVKPKGGNWLAGSVEDVVRGLKPLPQPGTGQIHPQLQPIADWIEGPLTKYVKTRMASPEDEVRKLAEQGVLHYEPRAAYNSERTDAALRRARAGQLATGMGESPLARNWEDLSDASVNATPVSHWRPGPASYGEDDLSKIAARDPNTPIHQLVDRNALGFDHLVDELSNALNPESGLPRNLQLTPEAVQNMSMEKAVRRVADINAWRAAQKVEANRKLAEQASMVREYPHSEQMPNPKGLRWVELKKSDKIPEGWTASEDAETWVKGDQYRHRSEVQRQALADQLKYEGDTMGHCVGGYCDDVLAGRSRIFSLRDAKGEPHVTVEVAPDPQALTDAYRWDKPSIQQIKGKQNRAPNPEYLPFVQDFVRNSPLGGQWSDVGDLGNTGLRRITEEGLRKQLGDYVTEAEWAKHMEGFASGGSVTPQTPKPGTETLTGGVRGVKLDDQHWSYFL